MKTFVQLADADGAPYWVAQVEDGVGRFYLHDGFRIVWHDAPRTEDIVGETDDEIIRALEMHPDWWVHRMPWIVQAHSNVAFHCDGEFERWRRHRAEAKAAKEKKESA